MRSLAKTYVEDLAVAVRAAADGSAGRTQVEHHPCPALAATDDGYIVAGNPLSCLLLNLKAADLQCYRLADLTDPELARLTEMRWSAFIRQGRWDDEFKLRLPEGTTPVQLAAVAGVRDGLSVVVLLPCHWRADPPDPGCVTDQARLATQHAQLKLLACAAGNTLDGVSRAYGLRHAVIKQMLAQARAHLTPLPADGLPAEIQHVLANQQTPEDPADEQRTA